MQNKVNTKLDASVVIATYNKSRYLELTLRSFYNQIHPPNKYEIIVVDDGSTDDTKEVVEYLSSSIPIRYVYQQNRGRACARNIGIRCATAPVIIIIDDDCIVQPDFITRHLLHHRKNSRVAVIGYRGMTLGHMPEKVSPVGRILQNILKKYPELHSITNIPAGQMIILPEDIKPDLTKVKRLCFRGERDRWEKVYENYALEMKSFVVPWVLFATSNVSVDRNSIMEVGLFDESFRGWGLEDYELGYRLHKHKVPFRLDRYAINYRLIHPVRENLLESKVKNYKWFCLKHRYFEVFLYWRLSARQLDVNDYNRLVCQFYSLQEEFPELAIDYNRLAQWESEKYGQNISYRQSIGR